MRRALRSATGAVPSPRAVARRTCKTRRAALRIVGAAEARRSLSPRVSEPASTASRPAKPRSSSAHGRRVMSQRSPASGGVPELPGVRQRKAQPAMRSPQCRVVAAARQMLLGLRDASAGLSAAPALPPAQAPNSVILPHRKDGWCPRGERAGLMAATQGQASRARIVHSLYAGSRERWIGTCRAAMWRIRTPRHARVVTRRGDLMARAHRMTCARAPKMMAGRLLPARLTGRSAGLQVSGQDVRDRGAIGTLCRG